MYIKFVHKTFSFHKHFGLVLTDEIRTAKFDTEVFVMLKHLMTKLDKPESYSYMSLLRAIILSKLYSKLLW